MEPGDGGEKLDRAWLEQDHGSPSTSISEESRNSASRQTGLTGSDRTQSGNGNGNSTQRNVPRPNSKSKSNSSSSSGGGGGGGAATVDKNGAGAVIPLSEKRANSMPFLEHVSSLESLGPSSTHQASSNAATATESGSAEVRNIARAASLPLNKLPLPSLRKAAGPSSGATVLLKSITPRAPATSLGGTTSGDHDSATANAWKDSDPSAAPQDDVEKGEKDRGKDGGGDHEHEEIPEEEAVCRICFEELSEEHGETLKMECSCRGEMALAHKDCALKWFTVKGNRTCDVCGLEVRNLPVTVVRQPVPPVASRPAGPNLSLETRPRAWQDIPVLVLLSILVYFCFLEQLLVGQMGSGALAISLPFSCVLGLLAAITASNLVEKRYVWLYATCQLALVICFAHIFYDVVRVEAVLSILLAAFLGFGVAMVTSTLIIEYNNYKRRTSVGAQREEDPGSPATATTPGSIPGGLPAGNQQQHHHHHDDDVVLQMEGGGVASLWLRPPGASIQLRATN